MHSRVVITGLGCVTPIGLNVEEFWKNALDGKVGIKGITSFDTSSFRIKIAGEINDLETDSILGFKNASRMDRYTQLGIIATDQAVVDSGLDFKKIDCWRTGVIAGTGVGGYNTVFDESLKFREEGPLGVSPLFVPKSLPNILSGNIAIRYGVKGHASAQVTACAAGSDAIGQSYRLIKNGEMDVMIAGASEACINPIMLSGFTNMRALSESNDPHRASIPFDGERSGFVIGEGAGILILESLDHAVSRGAKIYAEIVGYGSTCDSYHLVSPNPDTESTVRSMEKAMAEANVNPSEISYVNAHGTGTPLNDKFETQAIKRALGEHSKSVPVNSTKSMIGHLLGAAGAVESIVCAKTLETGFIHMTAGYSKYDPECDLNYVTGHSINSKVKYALSNSFGFGGHNTTLLFKKW